MRVCVGGMRMASIYLSKGEITSESHDRASIILKEALIKNAGVYIKLG